TSGLQMQIKELGDKIGTRFTLIDKNGVVIADSREDPKLMDNHGARPEILSARSHGEGNATRYSDTIGIKMIYYALPINRDGNVSGYVRTSISLSKIDERLAGLKETVALGAGLAVIAVLVLGYFMALHFSRPIESITRVAESMALGKYDEKVAEEREDEIGKLARALNLMADNLKERIETISGEGNRLKAILAGMVEGVIAIDIDERIVHINKAACEITNTSFENSIGKPLWKVTGLQELNDILEQTITTKSRVEKEIKVFKREGSRHIQILSAPTLSLDKKISGAVIVLHDITDLYAFERVRRDFVANVSHELKTPVTAIRALVETMVDDTDMHEDDRLRFLKKIEKQSIRLATLVGDVLTLSKQESEKGLLDGTRLDLKVVVNSVIQALSTASSARDISIESELPAEHVLINGDEEAVSQAISNLANNALKYTPHGGHVAIRLKKVGPNVLIEVEDNGIGIAPEHQQRIFERFYRVDKARSRELGGTGLGLSIVKHVAISHGGGVEVESEPGRGTVFRITIPRVS
ncbi:Phosphate regulon sensor protein PhoR (SphS), partial [hydrothermal vent metagenome]